MSRLTHGALIAVVLCLAIVIPLGATSFRPMSDREMVERADAIVRGTVIDSLSRRTTSGSIVTDSRIRVEKALKGDLSPNEIITVTEFGGTVDGKTMYVVAGAKYAPGQRVLAFLGRSDNGDWHTYAMSIGRFAYERDGNGRAILTRSTDGEADPRPRLGREFESFVDDVLRGRESSVAYFTAPVAKEQRVAKAEGYPASAYCLYLSPPAGTRPVRWQGGESGLTVNFGVTGSVTGANASSSASGAAAAWTNNHPYSAINLTIADTPGTTAGSFDGKNTVYLGYTGTFPPGVLCDQSTACAVIWIDDTQTHTFGGTVFYNILNSDIVLDPGSYSQAQTDVLLAHEFGHAIGLRHADSGTTPSTPNAIMASTVPVSFGQNLQQWDRDAIDTVYGSGPPCVPPSNVQILNAGSVAFGSSATLSVTANGSTPFTYQWYEVTSSGQNPISGATGSSYKTPVFTTQSATYAVTVTNSCGNASAQATVTPTQCNPPAVTVQPQSVTIQSGQTATLNVSLSGTQPFQFQWYIGQASDTSQPIPQAGSATYTTPALTQTTSYWVRILNPCSSADSATATVTVPGTCTKPVITTQPQSVTIDLGKVPTVTVIASGAVSFQWYRGSSGDTSQPISGATSQSYTGTPITTAGTTLFWVRVTNSCGSADSSAATITVSCSVSTGLVMSVPPSWPSGTTYVVTWTGDPQNYDHYELQEAANIDFLGPSTFTSTTASLTISGHTVASDTRYSYRVRGFLKCSSQTPQPYSATASTLVTAPPPPTSFYLNPVGAPCTTPPCKITGTITGTFTRTGKQALATTDTFTVTADKPFITFSPSSGTVPPSGSVTVDYTIDTTNLPGGSTATTVTFDFTSTTTSASGAPGTLGTTTAKANVPLSVSLVSPVSPVPKGNNPPSNTLIIPAVAHAAGINSQFVSDLRLVNTASQSINYTLTFTPSGTDGTVSGKSFQISIAPGETKAINDIVQTWFGAGAAGEVGLGTVEIRPTNFLGKVGVSLVTVAASRTYNVTPTGTYGQFIPAIPVANFLGKSDTAKISLQQVAQSAAFRTNLGLVEGSGQAVSLELRLLDKSGKTVAAIPWSLKPYEFQQQSFGTLFPGVTLNDGRVEVRVLSDKGTVSAYASVLDNLTNDPLAVFPVQPDQMVSQRYVVPGVADLNNGAANFHTDIRILNGGTSAVTATATYVPQTGSPGANAPLTLSIAPGEVKALDDTLKAAFNVTNSGGAVVVTTASDSSLVVTARTFSRRDDGGTFGQFIPGVTSSDGVGSGDRPLQVIQLEQSPAFRSNVGLVELTGKAVNLKVRGYSPDSKVSATIDIGLGPNEFRQVGSIFAAMGYGNTYNGRVTVEVTSGDGRVAAYGSVIDNRTQDPTYVPAQ